MSRAIAEPRSTVRWCGAMALTGLPMLRELTSANMPNIDRWSRASAGVERVDRRNRGRASRSCSIVPGLRAGWRGRAELVRQGADQGEVTAVFDLTPRSPRPSSAGRGPDEPATNDPLRPRNKPATGRKDRLAERPPRLGRGAAGAVGDIVELHGQHDDRGLLNPRGHPLLRMPIGGCPITWRRSGRPGAPGAKADEALARAREQIAALQAEEDYLRHAVDELTNRPGAREEAALVPNAPDAAAQRIGEDIARAAQALGPDGGRGAGWAMRCAGRRRRRSGRGAAEAPLSALERALNEGLGDAQAGVEAALEALSFDPMRPGGGRGTGCSRSGVWRANMTSCPMTLAAFAADWTPPAGARCRGRPSGRPGPGPRKTRKKPPTGRRRPACPKARRQAAARLDAAMGADSPRSRWNGRSFTPGSAPAIPARRGPMPSP